MRESQIQKKIRLALEGAGWLVNKIMSCSKPGWVDLEAFRNKVAVFIEVKIPGEKPRELQEYRHKQIRDQGFEVIVAEGLNEVSHLL